MITFFNGRRRGLGDNGPSVYAQIDVAFRDHLHLLRGAKLAVLLAIALHANEDGWAWPSYAVLAEETGYSEDTIRQALRELCALEINGCRVLLRYQPRAGGDRTFESNRYLIFPSPEEVERYEGAGTKHLGAESGGGFQRTAQAQRQESPSWGFPTTEKFGGFPSWGFPVTEKPHDEPEPSIGKFLEPEPSKELFEEEQEEEKDNNDDNDRERDASEIAQTLTENGVFPAAAQEIARQMADAGLSAEDALGILLRTIQSIQTGMSRGEEEVMSLAVDRLRRGIWDAGERVRDALRRARYSPASSAPGTVRPGQFLPGPTIPTVPTVPKSLPEQPQEPPLRESRIWQATLSELQLELTRATFETWLRDSRLVACEDGVFVVGVANEYAQGWCETRLKPVVERILTRFIGKPTRVRFVVAEDGNAR